MCGPETTITAVKAYLDGDGYGYRVREDAPVLDSSFKGDNGIYSLVIATREKPERLMIVVPVPIIVPEDARPAMAEVVTRANNGLVLGRFELDMSSGTICFRADMPIAGVEIGYEQFRDLFDCALGTTDLYFPAFTRLLFGDDMSPAEVIAEVEMAM